MPQDPSPAPTATERLEGRGLACPACDADGATVFLRRSGVPVHQNLLFSSPEAAREMERGSLRLACCGPCGFVFNADFDPAKLTYGTTYESAQTWSPTFRTHLDALAKELVSHHGLDSGYVVEVGCGAGGFLRLLAEAPGSRLTGHGYDPAYRGPERDLDGRLRFTRAFFQGDESASADAVISRHVIEHVQRPMDFLEAAARALAPSPQGRLILETPCVEWIFRHGAVWDFFYEHCSYFSSGSLATACARAGLGQVDVRHEFEGQYLWAVASAGEGDARPDAPTLSDAQRFGEAEQEGLRAAARSLRAAADRGPTFLWGAGAKGVTFANLVDPDRELIAGVVDINPRKQGGFLPGTGHPILDPESLEEHAVATVALMNPNYRAEIEAALAQCRPVVTLMDIEHLSEA